MKKVVFLIVAAVFAGGFFSPVVADTLFPAYCISNQCLTVEYVGDKFPTWGANDVEAVQWDRIVKNNDIAEIYLVAFGYGETRVASVFLQNSQRIAFIGGICGIPCNADFQIKALVWQNDVQVWKWWAIGPREPIKANFNPLNAMTAERPAGWVFQTTCGCTSNSQE